MPERRQEGRDQNAKRLDLAVIIPAFGMVLLMPFLVNLFVVRERIFGVPLEMAYLFGVWFYLVAGAIVLARVLPPAVPNPGGPDEKLVRGKRP